MVDVVQSEIFVFREGETAPDHGFGLNWRDKECRLVIVNIVCKICIWQRAAGKVVEESTLSEVVFISNAGPRQVGEEQDLKSWVSSLSSIIRVFCPSR